jgi:hypothetical protein
MTLEFRIISDWAKNKKLKFNEHKSKVYVGLCVSICVWRVAGEKFTVDASSSIYVSVHLGTICESVLPLVVRVPGVHCMYGQLSKYYVCSYFFLYYVLLQVQIALNLFNVGRVSPLV